MRTAMALQPKSALGFNWTGEAAETLLIQDGARWQMAGCAPVVAILAEKHAPPDLKPVCSRPGFRSRGLSLFRFYRPAIIRRSFRNLLR